MSPAAVTWASLVVSAGAAVLLAAGRLAPGLWAMGVGQFLDGLDGAVARLYHLGTPDGHRLDTRLDRLSEALIFAGFAAGGFAPWRLVILALVAILLMTSIADRSGVDPFAKRTVLYFGIWLPFPLLFTIVFAVNLAGFVVGMLVLDCRFQVVMDDLGGDLDTVASRAAAVEAARPAGSR